MEKATIQKPSGMWQACYPSKFAPSHKRIGNFESQSEAAVAFNMKCIKQKDPKRVLQQQWTQVTDELPYVERKPLYDLMKSEFAGKAKKFHGVGYHARTNKFVARVNHNGKQRGKTFFTAERAAAAVDSFSHYVEKQNRPRNFSGTPKKIDWPEMP